MSLFHRKQKILPIPEGFTKEDIRTESSICTGETVIGFFNHADRKLYFAELVKSGQDIDNFYARYGIRRDSDKN